MNFIDSVIEQDKPNDVGRLIDLNPKPIRHGLVFAAAAVSAFFLSRILKRALK